MRTPPSTEPGVQVLAIKDGSAGLTRGMHDERIPERNLMEPVQFDRGNHIARFKPHHDSTS